MKMKTVELTVGGFMLAGVLSLLMLALQVSGLSHFFKEQPGYKIMAQFSNIGGLKEKAKVSIAGVEVGRVTKIKLDSETFNASVWLAIDPKRIDKLPIDTHASILTSGMLGDNYISLTPGFNEDESLKEGDVIDIGSTDSAVILEQLVSKFLAHQASNSGKKAETSPAEPAVPVSLPSP